MKPIWAAHVLISEAPAPDCVPGKWSVPSSPHQDNAIELDDDGSVHFHVEDSYYSGSLGRYEALALAYAIIRNFGKTS